MNLFTSNFSFKYETGTVTSTVIRFLFVQMVHRILWLVLQFFHQIP